jgi:hypothetical protein
MSQQQRQQQQQSGRTVGGTFLSVSGGRIGSARNNNSNNSINSNSSTAGNNNARNSSVTTTASNNGRRPSGINMMEVDQPTTVIVDSTSPLPLLVIEGTTSPLEAITTFIANSPISPTRIMSTSAEITIATSPERALLRFENALMRQYLRQVLQGCGRHGGCSNPYCASNPSFAASFTRQQLPTLAAMLARSGPDNMCANMPSSNGDDSMTVDDENLLQLMMPLIGDGGGAIENHRSSVSSANSDSSSNEDRGVGSDATMLDPAFVEYMDLEQLNELVAVSRRSDDWKPMRRAVHTVFSSVNRLARSFRPTKDVAIDKAGTSDIQDILKAYSLITSCPQSVVGSMMLPTKLLLDRIKIGYEKWSVDNMRGMIILLANPLLLDSNYHSNVLCNLCDVIGSASSAYKAALAKSWIESRLLFGTAVDSREQRKEFFESMETVVSVFQLFITMRTNFISQIRSPITPNRDDSIIQAVKTLAIFCKYYYTMITSFKKMLQMKLTMN